MPGIGTNIARHCGKSVNLCGDFLRPHQFVAPLNPVEYMEKEFPKTRGPVLPMWPASTKDTKWECGIM